MDLKLQIVLQKPPAGLGYGLQEGGGSNFKIIQPQLSTGRDLYFTLAVKLKTTMQKLNAPQFAGPFVQGKPLEQFLYISIGSYAGLGGGFNGRIKIPLYGGITWDMLDQLTGNPNAVLAANIPGTRKDGKPNCATVKPFEGWKVKIPSN